MDKYLNARLDARTPKLNPLLANGYVTECMKGAIDYIDLLFRCCQAGYPEGFVYEGYTLASPLETYRTMTQKRFFELAESQFRLVNFHFSYMGQRVSLCGKKSLETPIFIPYVSEANLFKLRGAQYMLSPILADNGLSVNRDYIYIAPPRVKLIFNRQPHAYCQHGQSQTEHQYVVWSNFYNKKIAEGDREVKADPALALYLFARFGIRETFRRFAGVDFIAFGEGAKSVKKYIDNPEYRVFHSTRREPRQVRRKVRYVPSDIQLVIKEGDYTDKVSRLIAGFFYVVDYFPTYVKAQYITDDEFELQMWKECLGAIHCPEEERGKRLVRMGIHFAALETYIDQIAIDELRHNGITVKDTYDLFSVIIERMDDLVNSANQDIASMYNKRLSVLPYVLRDIKNRIFNLLYELQRTDKLTFDKVFKSLRNNLKAAMAYRMSPSNKHGEMEIVTYPGDNKAFRITSHLVLQENATRDDRLKLNPNDPSRHLHVSIAEIGTYMGCPKFDPTGRSSLNLYVEVDPDGFVVRSNRFRDITSLTQKKIERL